MKKIFAIIAVALALTFLASGILSGCNAKNSASAANAGKMSAKKVDMTIDKLDTFEDKDFKFPAAFGNDFFVDETKSAADCTPGTDCEPCIRRINHKGYRAKYLGNRQLNHDSAARSKFLDDFDDLYVLCADISAANAKCKAKIAEINKENKELKQLSKEMKKSKKKGEKTFAKFNFSYRELNESVTKLNRNRNHVKAEVKRSKRSGSALDVETLTMRNLMILNRVENRLSLLEDVHERLVKFNEAIRQTLGKQISQPESEQQNYTQKSSKPAPSPTARPARPPVNRRIADKLFEYKEQSPEEALTDQPKKIHRFKTLPHPPATL